MNVTLDTPVQTQFGQEAAPTNHLEQRAHWLAETHTDVLPRQTRLKSAGGLLLLSRLPALKTALQSAYQRFRAETRQDLAFSYAGEWMLDNFYLIEETLRLIREDMPARYYVQLPKLRRDAQARTDPLANYPRIYALARELVESSTSQLDLDQAGRFVQAYQQVTPLTMGELWALPIMLRYSLLEKLARAVVEIAGVALAEGAAFLAPGTLPTHPTDEGIVGNCFLSLRQLATRDWKTFFEDVSRVEQVLRHDPAGVYAQMDFETRNRYRSVIEDYAPLTRRSEEEIAQKAVELARRAGAADTTGDGAETPPDILTIDRTQHVGYYLLDAGRRALETSLDYHPGGIARLRRGVQMHPFPVYLGSITLLTVLLVAALAVYARLSGGQPIQIALTILFSLVPAVMVAVGLVNWIITRTTPPRVLPRLDFDEGIPATCRTMVVVPTMLSSAHQIESLLQELELHFLRNPDPRLSYALLTDFLDAPAQHMPGDQALVDQVAAGIRALNGKYGQDRNPFYLFHRPRQWNPAENTWMGWERKRGKLAEFNRLVSGPQETSYEVQIGDLETLTSIKYVITLDVDTLLPRGEANRLVATLAHPLNRALFVGDRVIDGYTVLQPRVEIKPDSANRTWFTRIFAGDVGIDLYTRAVSDVYQDFFGEGSYVGKGIYDVQAFRRSLIGRVPENALLSHDLFEGIHGRAGLVTDIILFEDYPPHYLVHALRSRRWIRGDWQLLPWLFPRVPTAAGMDSNRLSPIDRWKILDNLRRSLLSPALFAFLIAAWLGLPGSPLVWTVLVCLIPAIPFITRATASIAENLGQRTIGDVMQAMRADVLRWLLVLVFLPYEALITLDSILTTLTRMFVTHRHMLKWTTAADAVRRLGTEFEYSLAWQQMLAALVFAALVGLLIAFANPAAFPVAAPVILVWLASPQIAYWISRPVRTAPAPLTETQRRKLRLLARRTWMFFEQYVGPDDHWLPPDHFQEAPRGIIAHHTSPTNIGLLLLSMLAAHDLGYIGLFGLALRVRSVFESLDKLERYRGHFLNWYDTRTLEPLPPRYVSTVDSGNLAACLIALRQACLDMPRVPMIPVSRWQGLLDILWLLGEVLDKIGTDDPAGKVAAFQIGLRRICQEIEDVENRPVQLAVYLSRLSTEGWQQLSSLLVGLMQSDLPALTPDIINNLRLCLDRTRRQLESMQRNLDLLMPWLLQLNQPPALFQRPRIEPALAASWQALGQFANEGIPCLGDMAVFSTHARLLLDGLKNQLVDGIAPPDVLQEARSWCARLGEGLDEAKLRTQLMVTSYHDLAAQAEAYIQAMDFGFLFDDQRQVFHIGYNVSAGKLDDNYYDLLASEARLASLICIAKGDIPQSHWLHLGRPITQVGGQEVLLSWSGTMFEYLMPTLLMRNYEDTLLSQSCRAAVDYQIVYGQHKRVPWGISESGFYAFDANQNYQYRAFGAPLLGFKRGLSNDLVITPYASLIALSQRPQAVLDNIEHLEKLSMLGQYGLYEAIDFTASRVPPGQTYAPVQSYMAHHQGMILLALCNQLLDDVMIERLHADPRIQSIDLLMQERIPTEAPVEYPHQENMGDVRPARRSVEIVPWRVAAETPLPQVHYLWAGNYGVLITNSGGGYSQWQDTALTRWRADTTLDDYGTWLYVQDRDSGKLWSAAHQPTAVSGSSQDIRFYPHKAEFRRRDESPSGDRLSLLMEIGVAPDNVEVRRVTLTNESETTRRLRLVSYGEVVMAPQATDARHPAFNKMFIESDYVPELNALVFWRRPRSAQEKPLTMAHLVVVGTSQHVTGEYESDRARFIGRGQSVRFPAALQDKDGRLSGTTGATLDPIMALGQQLDLAPHSTVRLAYLTLVANSREEILRQAKYYQAWSAIDRVFDQARAQSEVEFAQLGLTPLAVERIEHLLSALLYPYRALRASPETLAANRLGQSGLWGSGISGDYPILLARINDPDSPLLHEVLQAFTYWHTRQIKVNLVILNQQATGYALDAHNQLFRHLARVHADEWLNQRDGLFLLRADQMAEQDRILLETVARVVVDSDRGTLEDQLLPLFELPVRLPTFVPTVPVVPEIDESGHQALERPGDLLFDNGIGGFSPGGREYVIYLEPGQWTPHPWINVIANADFGFMVSEAGSGNTWSMNSGENRLTPWGNDPVRDVPGEVLYLRDEETSHVWSPTPLPAREESPYLIRHGAGYSIFEHLSNGLVQRESLFASPDDPLKIVRLRLENTWNRNRRITVTYFADWVLGTQREDTQPFVVTEFDAGSRALFASNRYNTEFGERVAFVAANKNPHGVTADRTEFLGRLGSRENPAALGRIGLASGVGAGLDPCAAIQLHVDLAPGGVEEVYFLVGQAANRQDAVDLIRRYQDTEQVEAAWQATYTLWREMLDTIHVDTPEPAMNLLLNHWLVYQTLACRIWGRSALYQSSGAFGFRDQLQDVLALVYARPDIAREHILQAARHQFEAGDVLHWWHPPSGRGVRTRFSDDLLWLPFVVAQYVATTGDSAILDERIPFLKGDALRQDEEERYDLYASTTEAYPLYEHCCRAIARGSTSGAHGLPLIGTGDWNDGFNRVGIDGQGESVWLGWFLYAVLTGFSPVCESRGESQRAAAYQEQVGKLQQALEANTWDGAWYRRAYYDDGWPLGSRQNRECEIDSIAQSWAVLSGAGQPDRARQAMESVLEKLVFEENRLVLLFTPPFNRSIRDPGYIKGYAPGIRENGGQYTHAALWAAWAFAYLDQGDRAESLFQLLNPIHHGDRPERYLVEPYVVAADVYSIAPHTGQGGWTWYTGSSGWMYRLGIEGILGLRKHGDSLSFDPCIPKTWAGFTLTYRVGQTTFQIAVKNPDGVNRGVKQIVVDGGVLDDPGLTLQDDGQSHEVTVIMG